MSNTYGNEDGYHHVTTNGSNEWVFDEKIRDRHWLKVEVNNDTAGRLLDEIFLSKACAVMKDIETMRPLKDGMQYTMK